VLNVVQGLGHEAGAALVSHPGVARISFTGSVETAQSIARAAAENLTPLSLELGGKSPFLVFADADLGQAVEHAIGQYDNAGQVCLAGTRLLVERSIFDEFQRRFLERARSLRIGSPMVDQHQIGPLITHDHLLRVAGFVERARREGARAEIGGQRVARLNGCYYEPTLFIEPPAESEILREEVFGPVLTLQAFDTEDDAVRMANDTEYGLAATIFTGSQARADRVSARVVAGTVWVNCFYVRDLRVPFGGARKSGIGREGGRHSFDFYCDLKTVVERHGTLG
jgi:5-carboxymethyl-2-hydroxymuconic-semialdehyde dehydrogenase